MFAGLLYFYTLDVMTKQKTQLTDESRKQIGRRTSLPSG